MELKEPTIEETLKELSDQALKIDNAEAVEIGQRLKRLRLTLFRILNEADRLAHDFKHGEFTNDDDIIKARENALDYIKGRIRSIDSYKWNEEKETWEWV